MADKKRRSQAEKAVTAARNKSKKSKNTSAKLQSNNQASKQEKTAKHIDIPPRLISASICIILFAVGLISYFWPDGFVFKTIGNLIGGLFGQAGFIISIPVSLYLFFIHSFSGKRPIKMRTICLVVFVLLCGCLAHIQLDPQGLSVSGSLIVELYLGGIDGTTGGLLCGLLAMLIVLCFGSASSIIVILAAVLTLLGGMQITIPSIIRAIQNRPRPDWETEEATKERQEPAAVVVNHIANKRIKYIEKRRNQQAMFDNDEDSVSLKRNHVPIRPVESKKADELMRQIGSDVEDPVAASAGIAPDVQDAEIIPVPEKTEVSNETPEIVEEIIDTPIFEEPKKEIPADTVTAQDAREAAAEIAAEIEQNPEVKAPEYCFPPIDLLKNPSGNAADGTAEMRENSRRLNETLASFKIEAHIINVTRGPSVTRYEVELEKGVRLSKLTTAADDIALSLGATGVRIAAVPGKISVVGIEVPNRAVTMVSLREVIDSQEFSKAKSKSSFAVGKDIGGNCIVGNISKLPHMLIAGTTGSGKSVCMNSIIISILYKASPEDVKLIMVDPKMVELGIYNGIPHLLIPVVTDPKKAAGSLQWAVTEMMRRYKAMSDAGVRDLESYNSIIESQGEGTKLPQVVVIIDELADLMLVAAKEVEESICRIAQMGRAAGIHLVIATQRPSSDVITGLMKANIPSRIAFSVASAMESRIILDTQGAEKLVGKGDMLYAPIGNGKPKRVQGCFVSDPEVEAVANYVKSNFVTNYDQEVMEEIEKKALQTGTKTNAPEPEATSDELAGDEMLPAAVDVIMETGQASVSMLQRRLKLGYARAARIVDEMEEKGIVGPFVGSKPRAILITKEQWETMKNGQQAQIGFDDIVDEQPELNS